MRGDDFRAVSSLWPQLDDLVPPNLPADVANARLVALARSLLIENRQLREALAITAPLLPLHHDGAEAA
jgi:hypothetical protein